VSQLARRRPTGGPRIVVFNPCPNAATPLCSCGTPHLVKTCRLRGYRTIKPTVAPPAPGAFN